MISRLRGTIVEKKPPFLFIEVADAFTYEVQASMQTFYHLPELGQRVLLYTQFIVRDDGHYLYGFSQPQERALFVELLRVNGVGAKMALAILSALQVSEFSACIERQDISLLQRIQGIGKKTAERLIIEMRDRLPNSLALVGSDTGINLAQTNQSTQQDAIAALVALGYKYPVASRAVSNSLGTDLSVEMLIRNALKNIDPH